MSSIKNENYVSLTYTGKKTEYPELFCKEIFKNLPKGSNILDIGCGDGTITKVLIDMGFNVYGIDISEVSKNKIKDRFKKTDLQKDIYPFQDAFFDVVFSKSVLEHLSEPDHLLKEAYRVLKVGGEIITLTPSWKHSFKEAFYIDHTHVTPFTRYSLEMIHSLENFKEVKCTYFYQLPFVWKYPKAKFFCSLLSFIGLPYRPFENVKWPERVNKLIRFSQEAMLLCRAKK